jgi:hypothetical protein
VREWMAAAYKPELTATLGSCMQDMMHCSAATPMIIISAHNK